MSFKGGESLLNFSLIRYVVERAEIISREKRRSVQYVIATNLSPINQEILDFCKQHCNDILALHLMDQKNFTIKTRPKPEKNGYDLTIAGINKVKSSLGVDHIWP